MAKRVRRGRARTGRPEEEDAAILGRVVKALVPNNMGERFAEFTAKHLKLMQAAQEQLADIEKNDSSTYRRIVLLMRSDYRKFLDPIIDRMNEMDGPAVNLDVATLLATPQSLVFSIMTNDAFELRTLLIKLLSKNEGAASFVQTLEALQTLMPMLPPGTEIDF